MIPAMQSALSGLMVAEKRLNASANNTANISTTGRVENGVRVSEPYTPQRVQQTSLEEGGVRTTLSPKDPATIPTYAPEDAGADAAGITQFPNVSIEEEVVQQKMATYDFKANLRTLAASDEMMKNLLNIVT